jgi:hypothetical protein
MKMFPGDRRSSATQSDRRLSCSTEDGLLDNLSEDNSLPSSRSSSSLAIEERIPTPQKQNISNISNISTLSNSSHRSYLQPCAPTGQTKMQSSPRSSVFAISPARNQSNKNPTIFSCPTSPSNGKQIVPTNLSKLNVDSNSNSNSMSPSISREHGLVHGSLQVSSPLYPSSPINKLSSSRTSLSHSPIPPSYSSSPQTPHTSSPHRERHFIKPTTHE